MATAELPPEQTPARRPRNLQHLTQITDATSFVIGRKVGK